MDVRSESGRWCSTSTSASAATPAASPARTSGPTARAPSTCGGTTWRPSPGTGFPTAWEDQEKYKGGWERRGRAPAAAVDQQGRRSSTSSTTRTCPAWTTTTSRGRTTTSTCSTQGRADQPTARPISMVTGEVHRHRSPAPTGTTTSPVRPSTPSNDPNLAGSPSAAAADVRDRAAGLLLLPASATTASTRACVASCPSGALYKRGEDGIVLLDQKRCRAWRACVAACPYKKTYFNWSTGKSEKCILCYPRLETGQAPACFHSCVGRIRYLGVLLYDAKKDGISDGVIESAQNSPVYKFVMEWKIALPPHIEYRTLPMLFYVPPMSPVRRASRKTRFTTTATTCSMTLMIPAFR
jgi:nitrate reductase beta subunit